MLARIAEILKGMDFTTPRCARIEADELAIQAIKDSVTLTPARIWPDQSMLLGVPLVPKADLPAGQWRAIDQSGQVMSEGNVLDPTIDFLLSAE